MLDQLYEMADDIKSFLNASALEPGPTSSSFDAGHAAVGFRFKDGRVEIHSPTNIHIVDDSDKLFSNYFEARRYIVAKYL